jgi:uncharacterized membrane protein YbhN (UPF0104 family)
MHGLATFLATAWQSLAAVSLGPLALAVILHVAKVAAEARAWHAIVRHAHATSPVRFGTTLGAFVSAIGANALLPARVGEALRVGVVRRRLPGSSVVTITATVVLETAIEVAFGAGVLVAVLLAGHWAAPVGSAPAIKMPVDSAYFDGAVALVVLAAAVLGCAFCERAKWIAARIAAGCSIVRSPRTFVARVLSWKIVAWALRLASIYAFLLAFHVPAAPWTALAVVAAQSVAASIPLLPGNAGAQQAAIVVALAGTANAAGLIGFGVGMQAATTLADLLLGAAAVVLMASREDFRGAVGVLGPRRSIQKRPARAS